MANSGFYLVLDDEVHFHLWVFESTKLVNRFVLVESLVNPFKFKEVGVHGKGVFEGQLSKSLTKAYSLSSKEWGECKRVSLSTIWSEEVL